MIILMIIIIVGACTLVFGSAVLCVFGKLAVDLFPFTCEVLISLVQFWLEVLIYVVCALFEILNAFVHFCIYAAPILRQGCHNLFNSLQHDFHFDFNQMFVDLWNTIRPYMEWIIYCYSLFLVQLYLFSDRIRNFFQGNNVDMNPDRNDDVNQEYDDYTNMNDHNMQDGNQEGVFNGRHGNREHVRNREQPRPVNRLYPALPDINDNSENVNGDTGNNVYQDYVRVDHNFAQDIKMCAVCFERERRTAVFPCGHTNMCEECTRNIMLGNHRCPICQRSILEYRNIYL